MKQARVVYALPFPYWLATLPRGIKGAAGRAFAPLDGYIKEIEIEIENLPCTLAGFDLCVPWTCQTDESRL